MAAHEGLDSAGWVALMKNVINLPLSMLPAVKHAVKFGKWKVANDPIRCVRENAECEIARMRLNDKSAVP